MFSHYHLNVATAGQHRDRLIESATRHRLVFGRKSKTNSNNPSLAEIVALPARMDRTSPRNSRVA
jgi:hypothetical protein